MAKVQQSRTKVLKQLAIHSDEGGKLMVSALSKLLLQYRLEDDRHVNLSEDEENSVIELLVIYGDLLQVEE